jgi:hypothetical protein
MVETTCLRKLDAGLGEPSSNVGLIDDPGTSNVRSDSFREKSKFHRENLAAKLLAGTCMHFRERCSPRGSFGYIAAVFGIFVQAHSRSRIPPTSKDLCNETGFPKTAQSRPSKGPPS